MIKGLLFYLILFALWLPSLEKCFHYFESSPLLGAITYHAKPTFSDTSWTNANYQKDYELYINDSIGFHNTLIRLRNQIDYSIFNKCHSYDAEIGKDGFIVPTNQIETHRGKARSATSALYELMNKITQLKDTLKHHNKNLIIMFAPCKGALCLKQAPSWVDTTTVEISDYNYMLKRAKENGIPHLDFNGWFIRANDTVKNYNLFPRHAAHWGTYAAAIAGDSMVKFIEKLHNIDLPDLQFTKVETSDTARWEDDDLFKSLNLFTKPPHDKYLYPSIQYNKKNKAKAKILFISDSFFFVFHYIPGEVFDEYSFWFYNNSIYSNGPNNGKKVPELDLKQELDKYDDVVLMATEWNLPNLGWGFVDRALKLYGVETKKTVEYYKDLIKNDPIWLKQIIEKSKKNNMTVDEQLTADANYLISIEQK